jgi:hypothetical protein
MWREETTSRGKIELHLVSLSIPLTWNMLPCILICAEEKTKIASWRQCAYRLWKIVNLYRPLTTNSC